MSDGSFDPSAAPSRDRPRRNRQAGMAVAALVCGSVGVCVVPFAIAGIALGAVQLSRIGRSPERYGGRGLAIAGMSLGFLGVVLTMAVVLSFMLTPRNDGREGFRRMLCALNIESVGVWMKIRASDNMGQFADDLQDLIDSGDVTARELVCPSSGKTVSDPIDASYVYISGQDEDSDPGNVLLYERKGHHGKGAHVIFVSGDVEFIEPYSEVERLVRETEDRTRTDMSKKE